MATKRTGRPSGRPKKDEVPILRNAKRNYVLLLRYTMAVMKQPSIRAAAKLIAAEAVGNLVDHESLPPEARKVVEACPPGMVATVYGPRRRIGAHGYINTRSGATGTITGAAEYIRQLDRQARREAHTNPDVAGGSSVG
jgi:hypothetical protein